MPAGFQAINDSNIVQIDANYKNYILFTKGYLLLPQTSEEWLGNPISINVTGAINPVIAVHTKEFVRIWRVSNGNGSYTFRVHLAYGYGPSNPNQPLPAPFWYYIYDSPAPAPAEHGVGMQVFTGVGTVAFDSSFQYMRVLGTVSGRAAFPPVGGLIATHRFGNEKVAILICQQAMKCDVDYLAVGPGGEEIEVTNMFTLTARMSAISTIETIDGLEYIMYSSIVNFINTPAYTYLALDVSNLD